MKIILKHILRNIKEKKGRSLLIIISLMIASCVFILNLTIPNQIIEANTNRLKEQIGKSDLMLASYDNFNINDLKVNKEEIKYVGVNQLDIIHKDKTLIIYGSDTKKCNELKLLDEDILLKDNEILISKQTAEKYNYKENDNIKIEINDKHYELKIKKILENKGLLSFKTLSGIVNENTFKNLTGIEENKYSSYYIDIENDEKIEEVKDYIRDNNSKDYFVEKLVDEEKIADSNSYTQIILLIIFVMATIMIFFVVNTLNKMIVLERMPVIGTFRSIGASKKKMNLLLVLENIMYGLFGGILGAVASIVINNLAVKLLLGGQEISTNIEISKLLLGIIFSTILEILMSITAIIKSNKYGIKDIIFEDRNSKYKVSKRWTFISVIAIVISISIYLFADDSNVLVDLVSLILFWVGIAGLIPFIMMIFSKIICNFAKKINNGSLIIAAKNLENNKLLISSTKLVVISISIMLVILNVSWTFNESLTAYKVQFEDYNIDVRDTSKEYIEYNKLSKVANVEKVHFVFMYANDDMTFNDKKFVVNPIVLGMKEERKDIKELNYKISDLKDDEILMDEVFLEQNNLNIGDTIDFVIKSKNVKLKLKIVGTVNSYWYSLQREIIVVNENTYINNISRAPFQLYIQANENSDLKEVISDIEKEMKEPDAIVQTIDESVEAMKKQINTIMSLFYIIIGLALTLAFVGIINNQLISFMERTRELAVLNSVCMSKWQIIKMLILENVVSNLIACVIGLAVSIMSVNLMGMLLNGIRMYTEMSYNYQIGFIVVGSILTILLATVILPIKKLKKINIIESIKYE